MCHKAAFRLLSALAWPLRHPGSQRTANKTWCWPLAAVCRAWRRGHSQRRGGACTLVDLGVSTKAGWEAWVSPSPSQLLHSRNFPRTREARRPATSPSAVVGRPITCPSPTRCPAPHSRLVKHIMRALSPEIPSPAGPVLTSGTIGEARQGRYRCLAGGGNVHKKGSASQPQGGVNCISRTMSAATMGGRTGGAAGRHSPLTSPRGAATPASRGRRR